VAEVKIHPGAEAEYEHALGWYLDRSLQAAEGFQTAFDEAIDAIGSNPAMFPLCDDVHRFLILKRYPYRLVYRWDGIDVHLMAVVHTRRGLGYRSS
jgi:plasmid stabilization system protein ParE